MILPLYRPAAAWLAGNWYRPTTQKRILSTNPMPTTSPRFELEFRWTGPSYFNHASALRSSHLSIAVVIEATSPRNIVIEEPEGRFHSTMVYRMSERSPLAVCNLFSASSQTADWGPSRTSSVTSSPL